MSRCVYGTYTPDARQEREKKVDGPRLTLRQTFCKGAAYGDVPGWSRLKDVLHEKDIAPLGLLDVCLRLETGAERAAYMASPIGRIRRACRKYRLKEGEDAILTLRRVKVSLKNCTLITALMDPQIARDALPDAVAPLLIKADLRTCGLDGEKLERLGHRRCLRIIY